jgi:hypothetical protein
MQQVQVLAYYYNQYDQLIEIELRLKYDIVVNHRTFHQKQNPEFSGRRITIRIWRASHHGQYDHWTCLARSPALLVQTTENS